MVKAKYFEAGNMEDAEAMAVAYFSCAASELTIENVGDASSEGLPVRILALQGPQHEIKHMSPFHSIYFEEGGVFLEIYESRGNANIFDSADLINYLSRKYITNLNLDNVHRLVEKGFWRTQIAPAQPEVFFGEDLSVIISGDDREASARLLEPEQGGADLKFEEAKQKVAAAGVLHGIDDGVIAELLQAKVYNVSRTIAKATLPVDGEDGKLLFNFSTDERTGAPREVSGGRVDYYSLDLYVPVEENQLLVTRIAATEGTPGMSVRGEVLKQKPGKETALPRGKNVSYNDDRTEMTANCAGLIDFADNKITVSNVYKVEGDVDIGVGNIDFDGNVQITGNVRSGHSVKATGSISINGGVEAATIISGGSVEVKGGFQGAGKGRIEADGSVNVLFVERGIIIADGAVKVDVCIHSTIETSSTLTAAGKRGAIIGGRVAVAGDIVANYLGALSGTKTEISVGVMPRKRDRIQTLEKELERIAADKIKLDQLDAYLARSKGTTPEATWDQLHRSGIENRRINEEDRQAHTAEIKQLKYELEHATDSKVHVLNTTFGGVRITIGSSTYILNDDVVYATFRYSEGDVVCRPCEMSANDKK